MTAVPTKRGGPVFFDACAEHSAFAYVCQFRVCVPGPHLLPVDGSLWFPGCVCRHLQRSPVIG
jgi:hypothetical protein